MLQEKSLRLVIDDAVFYLMKHTLEFLLLEKEVSTFPKQ